MKRQKSFDNDNPKLYLVATPIGNLEDITFRAINTLKMVDVIYCEDTRTSFKLLNHYDITTKLKSVHLFNENDISHEIINTIKGGLNVAIISDAGLPIISDPGWVVVKEAVDNDIDVVSIPGATAGLTALIASGIPAHAFYFAGFLNSKKAKRKQELKKLYNKEETIIMYESPHRIVETLNILDEIFTNLNIVLARELTKKYEEYLRGKPKELLEVAETLKGEMVLIIEGNQNPETDELVELNDLSIEDHFKHYVDKGMSDKDSMKQVALDRHISKKEVYEIIKK